MNSVRTCKPGDRKVIGARGEIMQLELDFSVSTEPIATLTNTGVIGRRKLEWRRTGDRHSLHLGKTTATLVELVPDATYPRMFRILLPNGELTDMVNFTRAKDAAESIALKFLNSAR